MVSLPRGACMLGDERRHRQLRERRPLLREGQGSGCRVQCSGIRFQGAGFMVQGRGVGGGGEERAPAVKRKWHI